MLFLFTLILKKSLLHLCIILSGSLVKLLDKDQDGSIEMGDIHLPLFRLSKVAMATNNFSIENKLGEGGFGPVYKVIYAVIITRSNYSRLK